MKEITPFNDDLEKMVAKEFEEVATPEFINMIRLAKAAYEHGYSGLITKEKVQEWVGRLYDSGADQRQIDTGKKHGNISINGSDVKNVGSYLELWGKKEGYLKEESPRKESEQ